jgi:hypothetical protein
VTYCPFEVNLASFNVFEKRIIADDTRPRSQRGCRDIAVGLAKDGDP